MLEKVSVEALPEMPVTIVLEEAKFYEEMCQLGWKREGKRGMLTASCLKASPAVTASLA